MASKTVRILKITLASLAGLIALAVIAGIVLVQTDWFREFVRQKIISSVEDATGGRVEVSQFLFNGRRLHAEVRNFVLHGTEPEGAAPLFRARTISIDLGLTTLVRQRRIDIRALVVDQPQANIIVFPDGRTNVPEPKIKHDSDKTALQTIVDLAIGKFTIVEGSIALAEQKIPLSANGENLRAQLAYELVGQRYKGEISMAPLYVQSAENPRLNVNVNLPIALEKDKIQLDNAALTTPNSKVIISGAIDHLVDPKAAARVSAQVDLAEVERTFGLALPIRTDNSVPHVVSADLQFDNQNQQVRLQSAHVEFGKSRLDASGAFTNIAFEKGQLQFNSTLAVNELARILKSDVAAAGTIEIAGIGNVHGTSNYLIDASVNGRNLAFQQGGTRIQNAALNAKVTADPHLIQANPIRLSVAGGQLNGSARLQEMAQYQVRANLASFDIQSLAALAMPNRLGYGGSISGPISAQGNLKAAEPAKALTATARLTIAPNNRGVPVRGNIVANYNGAADTIDLGQSFVALPSTRLDFSGSLGNEIAIHLNSRNLDDFRLALAATSSQPPPAIPVKFDNGGSADLTATIRGKLTSPVIMGHAAVSRFAIEQRHFDVFAADLHADPNSASVQNASLTRGDLRMDMQASIGLNDWKTTDASPISATVSAMRADLLDVLALAGKSDLPLRGALTLNARAEGTLGDPEVDATVLVQNGEAYGEPIDRLDARLTAAGTRASIPSLQLASGPARLTLNADFDHPAKTFTSGTIRARVNGNQIALARLKTVQQKQPGLDGSVQLNLDAVAQLDTNIKDQPIRLTSVNGDIGLRNVVKDGKNAGDLTANISTSGKQISYRVQSNLAGSNTQITGQTTLDDQYTTSASLAIRGLQIDQALALAGNTSVQAKGTFDASGQLAGPILDPQADFDLDLTKAEINQQPLDRLQGHINYSNVRVDIPSLSVQTGPNRVNLSGSFTHPPRDFSTGDVTVHVDSNSIQLAQLRPVQQWRSGLTGAAEIMLDTTARLNAANASPRVSFSTLNARVAANQLRLNGRDFGGLNLTAAQAGTGVRFDLNSNVAQSTIQLTGQVEPSGDYATNAQLKFSNVRYANFAPLLGAKKLASSPAFDALIEGTANVSGPVLAVENLTGGAQLTRVEITTDAGSSLGGSNKMVTLQNDGPIGFIVNRSGVQVEKARLTGPSTQIALTGGATLRPAVALNFTLNADVDLGLLHDLNRNIASDGTIAVNATATGPATKPNINGRIELRNAAFQMLDMPNGLSKANGTIVLAGDAARIESLTAESGGGRINITGTVARSGDAYRYALQTRANNVRVRAQSGISASANANLSLTGTTETSLLAGDVTIRSVGLTTHSDIGSILTQAGSPPETPGAPSGIVAGMKLNVNVRMAPNAEFQSSLVQNLQANADLTVRGTAANPGLLGRVNVTQGTLLFFGTKYTVNEGSVSFYNPSKIEPVLNLALETTARGVNVVLTVSGPVENMNLSYVSDPPLPFSEIVSLLAAGRTPTSDPVLVARQPPTPPQTFQQMGASALLGSTVTNPVAGQLQRVFGVSQLKIDPTFTSGSELPQARLTLQQQISSKLTFTYVTNLTRSDSQIIRVEWAIDPQWSAIASRQENGMVGVDLFYKKRFR